MLKQVRNLVSLATRPKRASASPAIAIGKTWQLKYTRSVAPAFSEAFQTRALAENSTVAVRFWVLPQLF